MSLADKDRQWLKAGKACRAHAEAARRPVAQAVAKAALRGLEGVPFASGAAHGLALSSGLSWTAFDGEEGAGKDGGYTTADVRRILKNLEG